MMVVFNHAGVFLAVAPQYNLGPSYLVPSEAVARMGAFGVDLFFVISGFVMTLSARRFVGPAGAGVFLVQRFIRIAPLFYLACLVMLAEAIRAGLPLERASILNSLTFLPIFDDNKYSWPLHYLGWTLAFEWVFYLLVALLIADGRAGQHLPLLGMVVAVPFLGLMSQPQLMAGKVFANPMLWEFAFGCIACILYDKCRLGRLRWQLACVAALFAILGVVALQLWPDELARRAQIPMNGGREAAVRVLLWGIPAFFFFCAFISFGLIGDNRLARLMKLLGDASYSIYLSHLFVVMAIREILNHMPLDADLVVLLTLVVAASVGVLVYRWVEQPMLSFGQRRIRRWSMQHMRPSVEYQHRYRRRPMQHEG